MGRKVVGFDGGNGQMRKHFIHFRLDKYNKSHKNKSNIWLILM